MIEFQTTLRSIGKATILAFPSAASEQLPSRGQVYAKVDINGHHFDAIVEPDGRFGHWLALDAQQQKSIGVHTGDLVTVAIEPSSGWPEPAIPADFSSALASSPLPIQALWSEITPMARWEWIRWVKSTNNKETRARRVEVSLLKMQSGKRRPCCFNLASCTDPALAKSGKLVQPTISSEA